MRAICVGLMFFSACSAAYATTGSITDEDQPARIIGAGTAKVRASFSATIGDFPSGTSNLTKTLTSVQFWWYPHQSGTTTQVQICYSPPYMSAQYCTDITATRSGATTAFNGYAFGPGAKIVIYHTVSGPENPKEPNSIPDKVIMNYTY